MIMNRDSWNEFRFWNRLGIGLFVLFIPALYAVGLVIEGTTLFPFVLFFVAGLWVAVLIFTVFRIRAFPCPRCQQPFAVPYFLGPNTLGRKCAHCGLALYSEA